MSDRSEPSVADRVRRSTPRLRLRESEALRAGIRHRFGDARASLAERVDFRQRSCGPCATCFRIRPASFHWRTGSRIVVPQPVCREIGGLAGVVDRHGEMLEHVAASSNGHRRSGSCPPRGLPVSKVMPVRRHLCLHRHGAARPVFRSPGCARLAAIAAAVACLPIACAAWRARAAIQWVMSPLANNVCVKGALRRSPRELEAASPNVAPGVKRTSALLKNRCAFYGGTFHA